jgi:hypothetical protein
VGEKNGSHEESGMCFDSLSIAELRELMGKEGVGSLCKEMMGDIVGTKEGESVCLRLMRKRIMEQDDAEEEQGKEKGQAPHDSGEEHQGTP